MARTRGMFAAALLPMIAIAGAAPPQPVDADAATQPVDPVVAEVLARDIALAEAHGRGDLDTHRAGLSQRYAYIDVGGRRVDADMLAERRAGDLRRVVSSTPSEEEALRISDDVVLLRGVEASVASYYGGLPRHARSRWSALWVREGDGVWRVVAETATPIVGNDRLPYLAAAQDAAVVAARAGRWRLALDPALTLVLEADGDALVARLEGQAVRWTFRPASADHWFADERPFELRFGDGGARLDLVTWGTPTAATRAAAAD